MNRYSKITMYVVIAFVGLIVAHLAMKSTALAKCRESAEAELDDEFFRNLGKMACVPIIDGAGLFPVFRDDGPGLHPVFRLEGELNE